MDLEFVRFSELGINTANINNDNKYFAHNGCDIICGYFFINDDEEIAFYDERYDDECDVEDLTFNNSIVHYHIKKYEAPKQPVVPAANSFSIPGYKIVDGMVVKA